MPIWETAFTLLRFKPSSFVQVPFLCGFVGIHMLVEEGFEWGKGFGWPCMHGSHARGEDLLCAIPCAPKLWTCADFKAAAFISWLQIQWYFCHQLHLYKCLILQVNWTNYLTGNVAPLVPEWWFVWLQREFWEVDNVYLCNP